MHKYLSAIGMSAYDEKRIRQLLTQIGRTTAPSYHCIDSESKDFVELRYELPGGLGLAVRGSYDSSDEFVPAYYFPFLSTGEISTTGIEFEVERLKNEESYCGICDDTRLGLTLVFYLQNALEVMKKGYHSDFDEPRNICLSALSVDGKIILPVMTNPTAILSETSKGHRRSTLVAAARNGDEEAMEDLTMEDMDIYALLSRRIEREDVFSIVETSFIPYGVESDVYNVVGIIDNMEKVINPLTMEEIYILHLKCNDIDFPVSISKSDLMGVPEKGRRFKGTIWLQGHACL